jgi:trk system potassium uptake protein TrkA
VTGVDLRKDNVEAVRDSLYEAVIGDATEREALAEISIKDADAVFISLGENITRSLLASLHAKELAARRIIVKGVTQEHARLLKHLGVERVVFPEQEIAEALADRFTWPNVVDFLPIDPEYSFIEFAMPASVVGQTLREANLRSRYGIWVIGIKDSMTGKLKMFPDGEYRLEDDQLLLIVGKQQQIDMLRELE